MSRDTKARDTKADAAAIRRILNEDWDPIGGAPHDEYDSHVWPVYALLLRDASRAELQACLRRAADEALGSPVPDQRLARVIDRLMGLELARR